MREQKIEGDFSLKEIMGLDHVQRLADRFCEVTDVFAYGVDKEGKQITKISGNAEEKERVLGYLDEEQIKEMINRVQIGSLEEQAVEDTEYVDMKIAAVSIRIEENHLVTWIVCGILKDRDKKEFGAVTENITTKVDEKKFYHVLDVLRDTSYVILENQICLVNARAESVRSRNSENEMGQSLKRIEATTKVVQLLDSDAIMEDIIGETLQITGKHLDVSSAQFISLDREKETMDVISEWCQKGVISLFDQTKGLTVFPFLNQDKPLVISSDSFESTLAGETLTGYGIKALTVFPITLQGQTDRYLCMMDNKERIWQVEDIKFIRDAAKLLQSVVQRQFQKNSLEISYTALEAILDNLVCGIYVRDIKTKEQLFANKCLKDNFATEISMGILDQLLDEGIAKQKENGSSELYYKVLQQWYDLFYTSIAWVDGRKAELFCLYDITETKIYQRKMEQQAYTDFLTGLYNRMCCERDLASHIDNAKKMKTSGALLYMDLDDFKHINDGLGHQYGDVLLKAISNNLKSIEGIQSSCYRMGGDEFVIIIPPESYPRFQEIIDEIQKIFVKPWYLKNADYYCTMSMGIVNYPESGESVHDLIVKADVAMYEAKKSGKNRIMNYTDGLSAGASKRLDMEKNMRDATAKGYEEFEVYFQPIIDIQKPGNPCVGAEALIRWNSAKMGFIAPSEFIPLAEYLGLINPIGNYVLKTACTACKNWNDNGHPNFKVNVNLSVIQLLQPDIVDTVSKTIAETGINTQNLTLEVTESLAINDMKRMKEILGKIKELGVRIALDDFGTGYSSLNHIREIPFDVIKVDQSFVKDLAEDAYSQSFIKMVSDLANAIDVNLCVEGIETKEQYKVLEGMKISMIQGYYFDRPMPRYQFERKYCQKQEKNKAKRHNRKAQNEK